MTKITLDSPMFAPFGLLPAQFVRRYKRFLADVILPSGQAITLHCPNTGAMKNCLAPMSPCWYSTSANMARKYPSTLEIVTTPSGDLAGINSARANVLVAQGIASGVIKELQGYSRLSREVVYGSEGSRIDFLLETDAQKCFVEVKSVTLMEAQGQGMFPDAVSVRGTKHLRELMQMASLGHRAVLLFCVQHNGIKWVEPADAIDALYASTLRSAVAAGVEVLVYGAQINPEHGQILLMYPLAFRC